MLILADHALLAPQAHVFSAGAVSEQLCLPGLSAHIAVKGVARRLLSKHLP